MVSQQGHGAKIITDSKFSHFGGFTCDYCAHVFKEIKTSPTL